MNCEEAEGLLAELVYDELDDETRTRLRAHIDSCATCRELAGDMRVAAKLLKEGIELETPVLLPARKAKLFRQARRARFSFGADLRRFGSAAKRLFGSRGFGAAAAAILVFGLTTMFMVGTVGGLKSPMAKREMTTACLTIMPAEESDGEWIGGAPTLSIRAPEKDAAPGLVSEHVEVNFWYDASEPKAKPAPSAPPTTVTLTAEDFESSNSYASEDAKVARYTFGVGDNTTPAATVVPHREAEPSERIVADDSFFGGASYAPGKPPSKDVTAAMLTGTRGFVGGQVEFRDAQTADKGTRLAVTGKVYVDGSSTFDGTDAHVAFAKDPGASERIAADDSFFGGGTNAPTRLRPSTAKGGVVAGGADPYLRAMWRFDEGSGSVAYDRSGYGNDGTARASADGKPAVTAKRPFRRQGYSARDMKDEASRKTSGRDRMATSSVTPRGFDGQVILADKHFADGARTRNKADSIQFYNSFTDGRGPSLRKALATDPEPIWTMTGEMSPATGKLGSGNIVGVPEGPAGLATFDVTITPLSGTPVTQTLDVHFAEQGAPTSNDLPPPFPPSARYPKNWDAIRRSGSAGRRAGRFGLKLDRTVEGEGVGGDSRPSGERLGQAENLASRLRLKIYNTRDMAGKQADFPGPEFTLTVSGHRGSGSRTAGPGLMLEAGSIAEDVMSKVAPGKWDAALGTSIEERNGKLVVMADPATQAKVADYLNGRRKERERRENRAKAAGKISTAPHRGSTAAIPASVWGNGLTVVDAGGAVYRPEPAEPNKADIFGEGKMHVIGSIANYRPNTNAPAESRPAASKSAKVAGRSRYRAAITAPVVDDQEFDRVVSEMERFSRSGARLKDYRGEPFVVSKDGEVARLAVVATEGQGVVFGANSHRTRQRRPVMGKGGRVAGRRVNKKKPGSTLGQLTLPQTATQTVVTEKMLRERDTGLIAGQRGKSNKNAAEVLVRAKFLKVDANDLDKSELGFGFAWATQQKTQVVGQRQRASEFASVDSPVFVHEEVQVFDHMESENNIVANTARGTEDAISDIPLGGAVVVGNLGVGGGGAGTYGGWRYAARSDLAKAREAIRESRTVSRDADLRELELGVQAMRERGDGSEFADLGNGRRQIERALEVKKKRLAKVMMEENFEKALSRARRAKGRGRDADLRELELGVQAMRNQPEDIPFGFAMNRRSEISRAFEVKKEYLARQKAKSSTANGRTLGADVFAAYEYLAKGEKEKRAGEGDGDEEQSLVLLKSGIAIKSRVVGETDDTITLATDRGRISIPKSKIADRTTRGRVSRRADRRELEAALENAEFLEDHASEGFDGVEQDSHHVKRALKLLDKLARSKSGETFAGAARSGLWESHTSQPSRESGMQVQEPLINLRKTVDDSRKLLASADKARASGNAALAAKLYASAAEKSKRAQEVMKWMPSQVDMSEARTRAAQVTAEARGKQTMALAASRDSRRQKKLYVRDQHERKLAPVRVTQRKVGGDQRIAVLLKDSDRRYTQTEQMHNIVLTQQKALEIAKANMRSALDEKMEMENSINRNTARGQEDRISDIPTGGTGVIGNLGVGGGGAGAYGFRGGGGRRRATLQGGGSRKSEASVDRALKWLGHNQRADGSWSAGNGLTSDADVGVTGMAVLSFLAAGHTEKTGKHKIAVMKAIDYLISKQNRSGAVGENSGKPKSGSGYNHAIAGLALSEAYGMARVRKTGVAAQKAVNYSTNVHQKEYSGWRYAPEQDADMAVTGWFISQLKSAKIAGLKVDGKGFQGAIAFLDSVTKSAGLETGRVSYQPGREPTPTMTAVGLVSRQFMGWKRSDPLLVGGANYLMQNLPEWEGGNADLYYWLHGTQGMFQMGGDWWKAWNASLRDMMIERQRKGPPKIDGSWDPVGPWTEGQGRALATALGTLALEVYYRYLPLYKDGPTDGQAAATARKAAQAAKLKRAAEMRRRLEEARRKKAEEERRRKEAADAEKAREVELATAAMNRPPPPVNPFVLTARDRLSTFAMDVDTAAYTIARKHIRSGSLPPRRTVRMEEFVNAFDYNYPTQALNVFNIHLSGCPAPFGRGLTLLKIGVQAKVLGREGRKPAHLIFVVDASGSMDRADRMPLVKQALGMLVGALGPRDRVSLVVFGADERIVIEGVSATKRAEIMGAVNAIQAGGYTNMFEGLARGYEVAARQFRSGEINRVILCSDGVANVGVGEPERMIELTQRFRKRGIDIASGKDAAPGANAGERFVRCMVDTFRGQGVTLTTAGFGSGSYDDDMLERLANSGDGAYVFIDSPAEARRVFVDEMAATLQTVAKDAKIQVEFDPSRVRRYRLIGYENRDVADKDFRNDKIDAGEVGSGQAVTALYEIELAQPSDRSADIGTVYVRYRNTDSGLVEEISTRIRSDVIARKSPSEHPRLFLAACAAETAEVLRGSEHAADGTLDAVERVMVRVANALPLDAKVAELLKLVTEAKAIRGER